MIAIDTSAILAIFLKEPEAAEFALVIESDAEPLISAASLLETAIVLRAKKRLEPAEADQWLDAFIEAAGISVEPVTVDQIRLARTAHGAFGRGTGHAAQLNYGDCFSYALSRRRGVPLLYKGTDFAQTDVETACPRAVPKP